MGRFSESQKAFADAVEKNQPFYPKNIFASFREIAMIASIEANEYATRNPDIRPLENKYWENAVKNQEKIIKAVDDVCEQIRDHLTA